MHDMPSCFTRVLCSFLAPCWARAPIFPPSGLETEWDYSGRKGRDGQKKKIGKASERKGKVKRAKDEEVNG